jgi:hypothetical protein
LYFMQIIPEACGYYRIEFERYCLIPAQLVKAVALYEALHSRREHGITGPRAEQLDLPVLEDRQQVHQPSCRGEAVEHEQDAYRRRSRTPPGQDRADPLHCRRKLSCPFRHKMSSIATEVANVGMSWPDAADEYAHATLDMRAPDHMPRHRRTGGRAMADRGVQQMMDPRQEAWAVDGRQNGPAQPGNAA